MVKNRFLLKISIIKVYQGISLLYFCFIFSAVQIMPLKLGKYKADAKTTRAYVLKKTVLD